MFTSSNESSSSPYEKQQIVDSAQVKQKQYDLKKPMGKLVDPTPQGPRIAKQNASETISQITSRVTRGSENRNLPLASKLPIYLPTPHFCSPV